jgi:hypothetical protein
MARTNPRKAAPPPPQPHSFLDALRYFLTPALWKQVTAALRPYQGYSWKAHPLVLVLLVMTWTTGDSTAERFETARAFYVAAFHKRRQPGKSLEGLAKTLRRIPLRALRPLAAALRRRIRQVLGDDRLTVHGFIPFGGDGSRVACPRSRELQERLPTGSTKDGPPQAWVTALVHLGTGVPWAWWLGRGNANERTHLRHLLKTLPAKALVVADAGFGGFEMLRALSKANLSFLIRLKANAPLYVTDKNAWPKGGEGVVQYWTQEAQKQGLPPIAVRVICLRGKRKKGKAGKIWLMTNVLDEARLPRSVASLFYRWRWRNEGFFRAYKRTLAKVKLSGRTVRMVHRELELSLVAVQLLLAQGAVAQASPGQPLPPSPEVVSAAPPQAGSAGSSASGTAPHLQRPGELLAGAPEPASSASAPQRRRQTVVPETDEGLPSVRLIVREIRREVDRVIAERLGPRQKRSYWERLQAARWPRRKRRSNQVRQEWPTRKAHKPPRRPTFRRMGSDLKELMDKTLAENQ